MKMFIVIMLGLAALVLAGTLKSTSDIEQVEREQFELWLDIAEVKNKAEILALPQVKLGEPFVLVTSDSRFAALCHCRADTSGYATEIVKVLFDYRKAEK